MNLGITVNTLNKLIDEQIKNGNGDKHILISRDDEGNGFHTLFYGFTTKDDDCFEELVNMESDRTHTVDNCVILG